MSKKLFFCKVILVAVGLFTLSMPISPAYTFAPAKFSKPRKITCEITPEKNVFFLVAGKIMKFKSSYFPVSEKNLDMRKHATLYAVDTEEGYIPICAYKKKTLSTVSKIEKAFGIQEFLWQETPSIADNLVQVSIGTGRNIKESIGSSKAPINTGLGIRTHKGMLVSFYNRGKELPIQNNESKHLRYSIDYRIQDNGLFTEVYTVQFVSMPKYTKWKTPQNRAFPSIISCYSQNIEDPLKTWKSDGNLQNWERCQLQFGYKTEENSHQIPITVSVPGKMIKTTSEGVYPDLVIRQVSDLLDGSIGKFHNVEALDYFKRQATKKNKGVIEEILTSQDPVAIIKKHSLGAEKLLSFMMYKSKGKNISHTTVHSILKPLIETGAINVSNISPNLACRASALYPASIVELLIKNGLKYTTHDEVWSPFKCAVQTRPHPNFSVLNLLLKSGHDPYLRDHSDRTFMQHVAPEHRAYFEEWVNNNNLDTDKLAPTSKSENETKTKTKTKTEKEKLKTSTFTYVTKTVETAATAIEITQKDINEYIVPCWAYYDIMSERSDNTRDKILYDYESKGIEYVITSAQMLFPENISQAKVNQVYKQSKAKLEISKNLKPTRKKCLELIPLQEEVLMKKRRELHKADD